MSGITDRGQGGEPVQRARFDRLVVEVYPTRQAMGEAAARDVANRMRRLLASQDRIAMVFAAAPSQNEFLAALAEAPGVDWARVTAFQLDEYVGLSTDATGHCGNYIRKHLYDRVKPGVAHHLDGNAADLTAEAARYSALLRAQPLDIACVGIGDNGHIAYNDPAVADFADAQTVKLVEPDQVSRVQQVQTDCFTSVEEMPTRALTMTIPAIVGATWLFCIVPASSKAQAVHDTLRGPIATSCPASILRRHERAVLYLDQDSAALI